MSQSYSGRWISNSSVQIECVIALDRVRLPVREVVGRVDAPGVAGPRMGGVHDPVEDRVAHVHVRRGHVDPRPEDARAVGELAGAHPREEVEVLLDRPPPPGAVRAGLGERPAVLADLVGGLVVHVGLPGPDQVDRPVVQLLEVVGRVVEVLAPVEAEPADVRLDRVDVLLLLLHRVRVVEPEVAAAAELLRDPEVQADRLRVPDVEVAVGLGREARDDGADAAGADVGGDDLADEVAALGGGGGLCGHGDAAPGVWVTGTGLRLTLPDGALGAAPCAPIAAACARPPRRGGCGEDRQGPSSRPPPARSTTSIDEAAQEVPPDRRRRGHVIPGRTPPRPDPRRATRRTGRPAPSAAATWSKVARVRRRCSRNWRLTLAFTRSHAGISNDAMSATTVVRRPRSALGVADTRASIAAGSPSTARTRHPRRSSSRASRPAPQPRSTARRAGAPGPSSAANRSAASRTVPHAGRSTVTA